MTLLASTAVITAALTMSPAAELPRHALDLEALLAVRSADQTTLAAVRLDASRVVDLDLERFTVTSPETRFVLGDGTPVDFDPSQVGLFRGTVAGRPDSHAFLAVHASGSNGTIRLGSGTGAEVFGLSSVDAAGARLPGHTVSIVAAAPAGGVAVGNLCGVSGHAVDVERLLGRVNAMNTGGRRGHVALAGAALPPRTRELDLAIETDYDLFVLFNDLDATAAYVTQLYGAVSDIFIRDVQTRIDLTFVRLWDDPDDLFSGDEPLQEFRAYWNDNMGDVPRDLAQFCSGRRDVPWGGIAYLDGICNDRSYSVIGYALGFFTDPSRPDVFNRDIMVTAHELGHNCGTPHTHDLDLDTCNDESSDPRRGSIMSYCGQTFTGGSANQDLRFHAVVQDVMREYMFDRGCVSFDCNANGIDDGDDIDAGTSDDVNGNGVPDECEDCNGNGTLDPEDIGSGASDDDNGNGVPDECEPDCNENGIPDDLDLESGSEDLNFNRIPDECEADCNDNGTLDYLEIIDDMALDLNRNARLDACEDCDGDGTPDLDAIPHANAIYVGSLDRPAPREYLGRTGTLVREADAAVAEAQDVLIVGGRVFVTSGLDDRVVEYDLDGDLVGDFAPAGAGLQAPTGLLATPDGSLLVASAGDDRVVEFDLASGGLVGDFVAAGAGGLVAPFGMTHAANGDLLVTSGDGRVIAYDGASGAVLGDFVSAGDNGGLAEPRGLVFNPADGHLLVCSHDTDQVLQFDGVTGAFIRQWNKGGTVDRLTLDQPWGIRAGPDGDIYVARAHDHEDPPAPVGRPGTRGPAPLHLTNARIYQFQATSGLLMRAYILGVNSGIEHPTGFAFAPAGDDCNGNLLPDACDIAAGTSEDENDNGIPDECESECPADVDGDGAVAVTDLLAVLGAWGPCAGCAADIDGDGTVAVTDLLAVLGAWGPCL